MKDRLKNIRVTLGYNQNQMANVLGIELNTYRGYEYKSKNLPDSVLKNLVIKFNINLNWLFTGNGDMFISECNNTLERKDNNKLLSNLSLFYKRFNKLQKENNMSDFQLSKLLDIPESRIEKLGLGKAFPFFEEINKIKLYFDISIDWLLYGETPNCYTKDNQEDKLNNEEIKILKNIARNLITDNF